MSTNTMIAKELQMQKELQERKELQEIQEVTAKHAAVVDAANLKYRAARDAYGTLMAAVKELKTRGWTSGFICAGSSNGNYHITVFPPGQRAEPRGVLIPVGGGARRYTIYMTK